MADFKSRELNIYSQDSSYKLKAKSDVIGGLGDVVMTLKYGIANVDGSTSGTWPIYIPAVACDYNNAPSSVSSVLYQLNQADQAEASRALAAESALQSDAKIKYDTNALAISQEVARATAVDSKHTADIASETLARQQADSQLSTSLLLETSARQAGDTALSDLIATNKNIFDIYVVSNDSEVGQVRDMINDSITRVEGKIDTERKERENEDRMLDDKVSSVQNAVIAEASRAQSVEAGLQSQISNLLSNTDAVALNSLAELVADYRLNGSGLESRIVYLEGVVAALVDRRNNV